MAIGSKQSLAIRLAAVTALALSAVTVHAAPAGSKPADIEFTIEGVGSGKFASASLAREPREGLDISDAHVCVTLGGGSPANGPQLLDWVKSNSAGGALATRPDATLTVPSGSHQGLKEGTYRLGDITIAAFRQQANRDVTNVWLDGAEVNCQSMDEPS